jgi:hypothetical protein
MTALIPNNDRGSLLARRSIIIGAAVSLILCAGHCAGHKSDASAPLAIPVWALNMRGTLTAYFFTRSKAA